MVAVQLKGVSGFEFENLLTHTGGEQETVDQEWRTELTVHVLVPHCLNKCILVDSG
jgi:hypothetical protein